ncbi:serine/threonine protein kinase-like domain-containing protein (plasmid) [Rhizobium phaseoli]|uniref:serine/threonine-protein kinase n=1 Tax=Rhizobium phaseoli TaxID=396 RepID=UPI0007EB07A0|nr:serine/threonine-protein kinase [Rhizobium phaseoli]ANL44033.1 serine/threonine protein kinase-like domain-containing protein [Rhizobium phaseoli]ANL62996.1 serine/threonine protein kinase-like domain-containing protein [Rhizobium phaseoli]ANL69622.1 serine/threonine protein kinase-like domain-containing protein [Rhizobium phaseoli]ANL82420.1 serine/threonine protein kinase-like domain-containing protein [Rhizobium phaseoli]ANM08158.1 serine/threonine protein kinase-like domain-containing p
MSHDPPAADFEEIARRFAHLWQALNQGSPETRKILIDRVRDALDRGEARLSDTDTTIIANSFVLERLVHDGAVIQVYRARHRDLGTFHAIKMPRLEHADDPVLRKLMLREAEIGMALRHPNIVATQTILRLADGRPALVMEWIGSRLAELLQQRPLSPADVASLMTSVLSGLGAIHAAGFVHCDLSPLNLLSDGNFSRLKIADFGVALEAGCRHRQFDLAFAGRPDFASPEQMAGEPLDGRSDLYAAGLLLTLLLSHCTEREEGLEALAIRLSQRDPQDRPENAKAALHLLGGPWKSPVDF